MERLQGEHPVINDQCDRCLSDSCSAIIATNSCLHKFCVKCFLYLWSRQKLREPCVCPIDGEKMPCLFVASLHFPEEIISLLIIYNRLFRPKISIDMARIKFARNMKWLYHVEGFFCLAGLIAYWIKVE